MNTFFTATKTPKETLKMKKDNTDKREIEGEGDIVEKKLHAHKH